MRKWIVVLAGACLFCTVGVKAQEEKPKAETKEEKPSAAAEKGKEETVEEALPQAEVVDTPDEDEAEEIVVTATRTLRNLREVGKPVSVVTAKDIEAEHPTSMAEVLRGLPGVRLTHQGGVGGRQTIQIRGANSEHTLLLINGVPITDPTSFDSDINSFLGDISPEDIERIEVLRGAQSTLYGADAIGGVINIILKEGKKKPTIGSTWEGGSQNTSKETVNAGGTFDLPILDKVSVNVTGVRIDSTGIPSLSDSYENTSGTLNSRLFLTPELSVGMVYRSLNARQHMDDWDGLSQWPPGPLPDANQRRSLNQDFYSFDVKHDLHDWVDYKLFYSESRTHRFYRDDLNPAEDLSWYYWLQASYEGRTSDFNAQANLHPFGDLLTVSLGYEFEKQAMRNTNTEWFGDPPFYWPPLWQFDQMGAWLSNKAFYMEAQVQLWERVFVTGGVRKDHHSTWYGHDTGELSAAVILPYTETKLKGNWGLGFKGPSLHQLFNPLVGNPALTPENSESWDIGFEQPLFKNKASVELIYFENDFYNLIGWQDDPTSMMAGEYRNLGNAETEGIELAVKVKPINPLDIRTYYTYTRSVVTGGPANVGLPLKNVPSDVIGINLICKPQEKLTIAFDLNFTGSSVWYYQSEAPAGERRGASVGPHTGGLDNPAYWKADLSVTYKVNDWLKIWGRCENMFDQTYSCAGTPTARISAFGGLGIQF